MQLPWGDGVHLYWEKKAYGFDRCVDLVANVVGNAKLSLIWIV